MIRTLLWRDFSHIDNHRLFITDFNQSITGYRGSGVDAQVRKLAERSSNATKEIAGLIKGIQTTVAEAVNAMQAGESEVGKGVENAQEAGQSLEDILKAAEDVFVRANQAVEATGKMGQLMAELVNAVDTVSAVVEEN
ncbi:MAG: hypothetical protein EOM73_15620, partial [Bacteroidia bacterium]|nr:hypothetical protein [Bacteroidia bacterium]